MENLTAEQIKALIATALATAMNTPDNNKISALDLRTVLNTMTDFISQTETMQNAIMDVAREALEAAQANALKDTAQDSAIADANTLATNADTLSKGNEARIEALEMGDGGGTLTPEQIEAARLAREANTQFAIDQAIRNTTFTNAIADLVRTQGLQDTAIQTAQTRADSAFDVATRADGKADANAGVNAQLRTDVDTLQNAPPVDSLTDTEKENLAKIPNIVEQIGTDGAVGEQGTGLKGDVKALKATDDEIKARLDEIGEGTSDISDFLIAHGETPAFNPGIAYRGTGDQQFFDDNQATIPGLILNQATGEFRIPAISLTSDDGTALPAGTRFNLANAYLNPGLTGTTVGFNPIFYIQLTQGTNVLLGAGIAGDVTNLARDWVAADSVDSFTVLNARGAITGTTTDEDILVRWVAVYNGVDATLVPRLSAFAISFAGQYEGAIEHIVHNVVDGDIASLQDSDRLLEGSLAANAVAINQVDGKADSNTARVDLIETKLAKPSFEAIDEATVVPVDTETVEATALNNDLGTGGQPFAKLLDGAVDTSTKFITAFKDATQFIRYGGGQIARVIDGSLIVYELIEAQDPQTDTEVKYITTRSGLGTRTRPAVLEFGVDVPGQAARSAQDSELFLDTGIPAQVLPDGTTISNVSMAFGIRTNNNWNGISETIQFAIRSGETRSFPIPSPIVEMTFTATASADGRIRCQATHNRGAGNSQEVITNGGAIRFDAGYTETVITPAVDRGQRAVNLGAFTGNQIIAIDTEQSGDSDTETVKVITAGRTFNTGYFRRDANRLSIATDNPNFTFYESEPNTTLTPEVVAQLDGADQYLGLYARTNHHGDALQLANSLIVPTSDGTRNINLPDAVQALEEMAGTTGDGLSTDQVRGIADQQINASPAIQANTAKPTEIVIDQKIETAVNEIALTPGPQGAKGDKGDPGNDGNDGQNGAQGIQGEKGEKGEDGAVGPKGDDGANGAPGTPSTNGTDGAMGLQGIQGEKGDPGTDGQGHPGVGGYRGNPAIGPECKAHLAQ
ncbi:MAG: collagen-like protein [Gammaproteobacteria bacterium]|nr:collagen-like protein [Gammaproteobacteria bacterium]